MSGARSFLASALTGFVILAIWHFATTPTSISSASPASASAASEYEKLLGKTSSSASQGSAIPGPIVVAKRAAELFADPFRRSGENDIGIAWHLLDSVQRVLTGYSLAVLVGVPLGFALGLMPWFSRALDPYIQLLRPVSPMAWMPLALYSLKDSGASAIFIIFICSLWPILLNTTYGSANVRTDWINVGRVMGLSSWQRLRRIVLPASIPMILTGMRISIGIAWLVIVAAEMVAGQSGIGFFVWNEWNNLQIASIIVAIFLIGLVGFALDQLLGSLMRMLSFRE
jgi:nitrate/nitrite transport system permease protein